MRLLEIYSQYATDCHGKVLSLLEIRLAFPPSWPFPIILLVIEDMHREVSTMKTRENLLNCSFALTNRTGLDFIYCRNSFLVYYLYRRRVAEWNFEQDAVRDCITGNVRLLWNMNYEVGFIYFL